MRITFVPHALQKMAERAISEEEARLVVNQPDEEGLANYGRLYAQKEIGYRSADEVVGSLGHAPQKGR